jgi:hypothetical protein
MKIACIYAYWEKDQSYRDNLLYFLRKGLEDKVDYYFCLNGPCSLRFPTRENIHVIPRENKGHDFGAYASGLEAIEKSGKVYDYYFFMNTSVRGPFIPPYTKQKWYELFIPLFTREVACVGTTVNILPEVNENAHIFYKLTGFEGGPYTHIQSMFFGLTHESMLFLKSKNFWNCENTKDFIVEKEIMMSQLFLRNNYNIACILPEYKDTDFRNLKINVNYTAWNGDGYEKNGWFGRSLHPYEVIFSKMNRAVCPEEIASLTNASYKSHIPFYLKHISLEHADINQLLPIIQDYASRVSHVTELGVCTAGSSYAFLRALEGKPEAKLVQCDPVSTQKADEFRTFARSLGLNVVYYEQSDLDCPIEPTELCFIDSWHVYGQLKRELARWAPHTSKYIVMHDTEVDGIWGETIRSGWNAIEQSKKFGMPVDEITKGLKLALKEFLEENREWKIHKQYTHCNGLTILERV